MDNLECSNDFLDTTPKTWSTKKKKKKKKKLTSDFIKMKKCSVKDTIKKKGKQTKDVR